MTVRGWLGLKKVKEEHKKRVSGSEECNESK